MNFWPPNDKSREQTFRKRAGTTFPTPGQLHSFGDTVVDFGIKKRPPIWRWKRITVFFADNPRHQKNTNLEVTNLLIWWSKSHKFGRQRFTSSGAIIHQVQGNSPITGAIICTYGVQIHQLQGQFLLASYHRGSGAWVLHVAEQLEYTSHPSWHMITDPP